MSFDFIPKDNKVAKGAKTSEFGAFFSFIICLKVDHCYNGCHGLYNLL